MDVKFNSLFDNQINQETSDHYLVETRDNSLLLSNLILQVDESKQKGIEKLEKRQFGTQPNYILAGRPCSAGLCSSGKFCDSGGWPNIYIENIDIEAKLRKIDYIDNKCHLKKHKEDPCAKNPEKCAMRCHKNTVKTDYQLPNNKKWDTETTIRKPRLLSDGINRALEHQRKFCKKLPERFNEASMMQTFMPTKRRDIIKW